MPGVGLERRETLVNPTLNHLTIAPASFDELMAPQLPQTLDIILNTVEQYHTKKFQ